MSKTLTIEFDDFPDERVVVVVSPVAMGDFLDVVARMASVGLNREDIGGLLLTFVPYVESWSYAEPLTVEGFMVRDFGWIVAVLDAWTDGVRDVPRPLPRASSASTASDEPA
jgi:hypothetical protein